jgi:predicted nucleic acid-binding protein
VPRALRVAVVDAGPLWSAAVSNDRDHARSVAALTQPGLRLVVPALVVCEASYVIGSRLGAKAEARFLASLSEVEVRAPEPEDWSRIAALVEEYRDLPLGGADASLMVLADRLRTRLIITLDRRDFSLVRNRDGLPFELLPA